MRAGANGGSGGSCETKFAGAVAELGLASITGLLALITPIFPDWIELVSGWDPDQHDGSVERLIVVGLFVVAATIFALAAVEWRRTPLSA
jgi:hypothetical protein